MTLTLALILKHDLHMVKMSRHTKNVRNRHTQTHRHRHTDTDTQTHTHRDSMKTLPCHILKTKTEHLQVFCITDQAMTTVAFLHLMNVTGPMYIYI